MESPKSDGVIKYFDLIDEFIKIRSANGSSNIFQEKIPESKKAYRKGILGFCIDGEQLAGIKHAIRKLDEDYDSDIVEGLLYQLCIDVNPSLEVHRAALPAPVEEVSCGNKKRGVFDLNLGSLETRLNKVIVGQPEPVKNLVNLLKCSSFGLRDENKPFANVLHAGRTGMGKTELAKALARELPKYKLLMINGSEFGLPHEYQKLIGAPPGYIGHMDGGVLTNHLRKHPRTVVCWDEVEEMHQKAQSLLLQVLDEGMITDNKGNDISFKYAVNVLTTNIGSDEVDRVSGRMGFGKNSGLAGSERAEVYKEALKSELRAKVVNRVDATSIFNVLSNEDCYTIARLQVNKLRERLNERDVRFSCSPAAVREVVKRADFEEFGGREIGRVIEEHITLPLANVLLKKRDTKSISVGYDKGDFNFKTM